MQFARNYAQAKQLYVKTSLTQSRSQLLRIIQLLLPCDIYLSRSVLKVLF